MMKNLLCMTLICVVFSGCQKAADTTAESSVAATPATFNAAGAPTVQFKVPDMMCEESCAKAVHDTLAAQPGAEEVEVDFPNRLATVAVDQDKFDSEAALAALLDKQFTKTELVEVSESSADPSGG